MLHRADYPRKPRACSAELRADFESRLSFCCNRCRRRTTSMSARFLGRRVYLGLAVVLLGSARHAGQNPAAARASAALAVSVRTLARWRESDVRGSGDIEFRLNSRTAGEDIITPPRNYINGYLAAVDR